MAGLSPELAAELSVPCLAAAERVVAVTGGGYWATMFTLKDGSLAAILRGGAPHVGLDSRLDLIKSKDGGKTWSKPKTIVPAVDRLDVRGSASGVMADGTIVCGYVESDWFVKGAFSVAEHKFTSWYVISTDQGKTWSPKREMLAGPIDDPAMYGRTCLLEDGTALMTVYGKNREDQGARWCGLVRSTDHGRTWGDFSPIAKGFNETTLIKVPDGRLLAFLREDGRAVGVFQAESTDGGRTWGPPRRLTKPHQHPADATLLASGNLLLTYGNRIGELAVGAMLSRDLGRTWDWEHRVVLAKDTLVLKDKTWGDCGYPTTVQLPDGTINTLYYRLGHNELPPDQQELCLSYERMAFRNPPAPEDMWRFEQGVCVRYTEKQLQELMAHGR